MVIESLSKALGHTVAATTYGETAMALLLHYPRLQIMRDEDEANSEVIEQEEAAEIAAAERKAELARRKAEREAQQASARRDVPDLSRKPVPKDAEQRLRA